MGTQTAREHTARWDGKDATGRAVSSGVYRYELRVGTSTKCLKMVLVRKQGVHKNPQLYKHIKYHKANTPEGV